MKITPLPKNMQCEEAIKCVFDLNKLDIRVYKELKRIGEERADALALVLDKERSTVYRSLQKLTDAGICRKMRRSIEQGGYYYTYQCNDISNIQKKAFDCLDSWYQSVKETLQLLTDE
ncbi:MAG: helix-turn-helix domain-containing protein [Candidatus Thermoplasmatota archaeon]|nr:helix-turn-helix domain-containing protein [Candidatus Thermoplasmatota archaeon]